MSYLNYTDFIAFDDEKLTCSFGTFTNLVETNKTFNLNNNTAIYINSKSQKVETYAKIILTSTYQDLAEWEVYDSVADINICNGICQIKGHKDCMMFEVTENTCRISRQVQKPMNKLNNDGTGLTKRTIFVSEGKKIKMIVERRAIFAHLLLEFIFLICISLKIILDIIIFQRL